MKSISLVVLAMCAVLALGCQGSQPSPQVIYITQPPNTPVIIYVTPTPAGSPHTVLGTVEASGPATYFGPRDCVSGDLRKGAPVTVLDDHQVVIGASSLDYGVGTTGVCALPFTVELPDAAFYQFVIANRGPVPFSHKDLAGRGWTVTIADSR